MGYIFNTRMTANDLKVYIVHMSRVLPSKKTIFSDYVFFIFVLRELFSLNEFRGKKRLD